MRGGAPEVQIVLIFNWKKISGGRVEGDLEVWDRNVLGNANLRQNEVKLYSPFYFLSDSMTKKLG
jgi:hypothetical protein